MHSTKESVIKLGQVYHAYKYSLYIAYHPSTTQPIMRDPCWEPGVFGWGKNPPENPGFKLVSSIIDWIIVSVISRLTCMINQNLYETPL